MCEREQISTFAGDDLKKKICDRPLEVMAELQQERKLCNAVLKVADAEFHAHKIILCSCSSYFCTLFTGAWMTSDKQIYTIPGVSPEMMKLIINYAYTHTISLTKDNVVEVLGAADQFQVPGIIQACCFFLEDQLCLENCIGIWKLVDFYHCPDFRHKCFMYVLHNFEEIVSISLDFLDLSEHELAALLESDHLNMKQENLVFDVVLQWINHRLDQRQHHLSMLLPKMRLNLMTAEYLRRVQKNTLIKNNAQCLSVIADALEAFTDLYGKKHVKHNNLMRRPRLPPVLLLVSGGSRQYFTSTNNLKVYDARSDSWATLDLNVSPDHYGTVVLDGCLYIVGGCRWGFHLNAVQKFNFTTSSWQYAAPMKIKRCSVSVAVLNGYIYAMGGLDGNTAQKTAERYNPKTNRWVMIEPMHSRRSGASATSLHGKVYICGGFNGQNSLSTAEFYDPEVHQWTMITPMKWYRNGLGVIAYKDQIYAAGGFFGCETYLNNVEVYNPTTNSWTIAPPMQIHRSNFGIEVVEDQLYVVGGRNWKGTLASVERYSEEAREWRQVSQIDTSLCNLSCCLLHGFYHLAESLFPRGP